MFSLAWMRDEYPHINLPLTWTELKYVDPFFCFKSSGFICRVFLFWSQMSLPSLPLGWTLHGLHHCFPYILGDIRTRQEHQFWWWRDQVRQNLLGDICMWTLLMQNQNECNEAGSKPNTYRLEFLIRLHKSPCSPPPTPGIHESSQRQTESAKKPACRS